MGVDLLTSMLAAFQAVLSLGMHTAGPASASLFRILATIELASLGLWWLYSHDNSIGTLIFRVMGLALLFWLMQEWQMVAGAVQASFMRLGLTLGGNHLDLPSVHGAGMALIAKGQELHLAILGKPADPTWLDHLAWEASALFRSPAGWAQFLVAWLVLLTFLVAGLHVFAVQLEFVFASAMAFITIPFAVWTRTAWVSERTMAATIGGGLKLAYVYMLSSATLPVLQQYVAPVVLSQHESMQMLGAGLLLLFVQWGGAKLASGVLHGTPAFTQSDVMPRSGMAIGLAVGGISMAARAMTRSAGALTAAARRARTP